MDSGESRGFVWEEFLFGVLSALKNVNSKEGKMAKIGWLKLLGLALIVGLVPLLAACGGDDDDTTTTTTAPAATATSTVSKEPIKIGFIWPYTGFAAGYGPRGEEAIRMRLDEVNWEVAGRPIELITADEDVLDASLTLERVKKLVEQDKVDIIIGPLFGSSQEAIGPYAAGANTVNISIHACSYALGLTGSWFCLPGSSESIATPFGEYIYDDLGYRTITTIAPDYIFGHMLIEAVADGFEARGGTITQQQWVPLGTTDVLPYATNLDDADALVMWLVDNDLMNLLGNYDSLGQDKPVMMINGLFDEHMPNFGPTLIDLVESTGNITGYMQWTWQVDNPASATFVQAFESRFGRKPTGNHSGAYVAISVALEALKATNGDTSHDALQAAILGLDLQTPHGRTTFAPSGMAQTDRYVVIPVFEDGRYAWKPIKTYTSVRDSRD